MANLGNPKNTIEIIQKYEFMFQKKFGQNFLIDTHVLEKIISAAGITKNDCVLEIGPGIGTMTQYLAENAGHVVAVEIDRNLIPILKETLADYDNVTVINEDILRVDIKALAEESLRTCRTISRPQSSWGSLRAECRSTILPSWSRRKLRTA